MIQVFDQNNSQYLRKRCMLLTLSAILVLYGLRYTTGTIGMLLQDPISGGVICFSVVIHIFLLFRPRYLLSVIGILVLWTGSVVLLLTQDTYIEHAYCVRFSLLGQATGIVSGVFTEVIRLIWEHYR